MKRIILITGLTCIIVLITVAFILPNREGGGGTSEKKSAKTPTEKAGDKSALNQKIEEKAPVKKVEEKKVVEKKVKAKKTKKRKFDYEDFGRGFPMEEEVLPADTAVVLP